MLSLFINFVLSENKKNTIFMCRQNDVAFGFILADARYTVTVYMRLLIELFHFYRPNKMTKNSPQKHL